jgi:hypothetical protein
MPNSPIPATGEAMPKCSPSLASRKISDVEDIIATARYLNEAIFMAVASLGDRDQVNAIQALADEINNKLLVARDRLDEVRGDV